MRITREDLPSPIVGAKPEFQVAMTAEGPVLFVKDEGRGATYRVALSPDEARNCGVALIGLSAIVEATAGAREQADAQLWKKLNPRG